MKVYYFQLTALAVLLTVFGCDNQSREPASNSFTFNKKVYFLDNCAVTNESFDTVPKFEIDLSCCDIGNPYIPNEMIAAKNFVWFSVKSENSNELKEGTYFFSADNPNKRKPMTFSGSVTAEGREREITGGKLTLEKDDKLVKIIFYLAAEDHIRLEGNYTGPYIENLNMK